MIIQHERGTNLDLNVTIGINLENVIVYGRIINDRKTYTIVVIVVDEINGIIKITNTDIAGFDKVHSDIYVYIKRNNRLIRTEYIKLELIKNSV
jgi:hypothetical protein